MMHTRSFEIVAVVAAVFASTTLAISQLSAVGAKFFTSDGNQFYIKGVAYQLTADDPLSNTDQCKRDAKQMQDLGANTIRVYHVDPNADHSGCMSAFSDAGIYLFVDLDTEGTYILQDNPEWNQTQLTSYNKVLDEFQKYDNLAGAFVGNEVLNFANASSAAPYVKAATRDVKAYRDSKKYRKVPIGYSAADIPELRPMLQNYLACGGNTSESLDFFSLNAYEWCGASTYDTSGYADLQANASSYNIPIFLSETGCNKPPPRTFDDQASIFGSNMTGTWSGAIIYEWLEETNNYGLISYGPQVSATVTDAGVSDGFTRTGTPTPISPDYSNLKKQWATLTPSGVKLSDYTASTGSLSAPSCPASTSNGWAVVASSPLPTLGQVQAVIASASSASAASGTNTAASATATKKGSASGGKEIAGMGVGLAGVLLGFIVWL